VEKMKKIKGIIDPGHGGYDPGAIGPSGIQEKVITLAVAKMLKKILSPVIDINLTRDSDIALGINQSADLTARANLANALPADFFVSIHCNSSENQAATGTETYSYPGSVQGSKLAKSIHECLISLLGLPDRGLKTANFAVLRQTRMPACLVEIAFVSNPTEEAMLESIIFQNKAAQAIGYGITNFLGINFPASVDQLINAVKVIQSAEIISSPDYWLKHARPGEQVDGQYVGILIQNMAKKIRGA